MASPGRRAEPEHARNPRIVFADLINGDSVELRQALEQIARALEGRLDAYERNQERVVGILRKYDSEAQEAYGYGLQQLLEADGEKKDELNSWASRKLRAVKEEMLAQPPPQTQQPGNRSPLSPTSLSRVLFVSPHGGAAPAAIRAMQNYLTDTGHSPQHRILCSALGAAPATEQNVVEGLRWLVSEAAAGQSLLLHYVGSGGSGGLVCEGAVAGRTSLMSRTLLHHWLVQRVPPGVRLTALLDCGHSGTPIELPYSVVAHRGVGAGFEMTRGEPPLQGGQVVLLSTYSDAPAPAASLADTGVTTHSLLSVLAAAPRLKIRDVLSGVRAQLSQRLGDAAPLALASSNRPFHPDTPLELG
eukprot:TRINITY_DN1105_c2_g1_i1.p1 TRINITY_DN1105_c2_g1~~TRINITY_DN1105_c2_g1_i1.p1  ORF type:complete len:359 (+),score=94.71 TRINITY_DN1105_c2_g1_i1:63-1139(+)